jgi:hypothetical protein
MPLLSLVLFTPLVGLLVLLAIPSTQPRLLKLVANGAALLGLVVTFPLLTGFDRGKDFQFVERAAWIPSIGAEYHLGVDGLALLMVVMTAGVVFWPSLLKGAVDTRLSSTLVPAPATIGVFWRVSFFSSSGNSPSFPCTSSSPSGRPALASSNSSSIHSRKRADAAQHLDVFHPRPKPRLHLEIDALVGCPPAQIAWWVFWLFRRIRRQDPHVALPHRLPMYVEAPTAGSVVLATSSSKWAPTGSSVFAATASSTSKTPKSSGSFQSPSSPSSTARWST